MRISSPALLPLLLLTTAVIFYKYLDDILIGLTKKEVIPYVLTTDDVAAGCVMTDAFAPLLTRISNNKKSSYQLTVLFEFLSGSCFEFKAWEEELRYLRASYVNNVTEAQDARIKQKRLLNQAASKQFKAFRGLGMGLKEESGTDCPDLAAGNAEFYWLIGMLGGVQAILNDLSSEGGANVPLDVAYQVSRGIACLDDQKWWGVPKAIQAAIWVSFPGNKPAGVDPLMLLQRSIQIGLENRMRISQVLAAQVYIGLGDITQVKKIIRYDAEIRDQITSNLEFRFLDEVATLQLQAISDRLWTEATGKRTPIGGLGRFSDDPKNAVDTVDINDIL